MKITPKRLDTIIRRYYDLKQLAKDFIADVDYNRRYDPIRIDKSGNINCEVNTSCHCHPEYEWQIIKTKIEFLEWLNK